jgi:hypothetical protein
MFTQQNTEGYDQSELDTLNEAVEILRETCDCEGLTLKTIDDAISNAACCVPMVASKIAAAAGESLGLFWSQTAMRKWLHTDEFANARK